MDLWTLPQHRLACSIFALKNWWFRVQTENAFQQNCTKVSRFFWTFKRSSMLTHRRCPVLVNVIQAFSRAGWGSGGLQQWRILQYLSCPWTWNPETAGKMEQIKEQKPWAEEFPVWMYSLWNSNSKITKAESHTFEKTLNILNHYILYTVAHPV